MTERADNEYYETVTIHGREFQKYSVENRIYCIPVDEEEEDRLISQHRFMMHLFDNKLFVAPIQNPRRILDCGYGRGCWALAMAQAYPNSEVTAIDIYPAELPEDQPDNLECEVWDLNDSLTPTYPPGTYDLIHSHVVSPGIKRERWRSYVRDLYKLLKRGGWVQMAEMYYIIQSDSGRLTENHALYQWDQAMRWCMEQSRDPRVGRNLAEHLRNAGFSDIQEKTFRIPIGPWPTDPAQRHIGEQTLELWGVSLLAYSLWPFTQQLGWTKEQVESLVKRAQDEAAADMSLKLYMPFTVVWGRKR